MADTLTLLPSSRYKRTAAYRHPDTGRVVFDLMEPVSELFNLGDEYTTLTVTHFETDFLDRLAFERYGDERLWWVIAYANGIVPGELVVGQQILIPSRERVTQFLVRTSGG